MNATDILKNEHRAIEIVLNAMDAAANALEAGRDVDPALLAECLDFATVFADKCHHTKEEEGLFPLLQERGVQREQGPIGAMLHEHDEGRNLLKSIRESLDSYNTGDASATESLIESMRCYVTLLRAHIFKEDQVLFEVADAALSDKDNEQLVKTFDEIESSKIGPGVHEEYHRMLDELERRTEELTSSYRPTGT